MLRKAGKYSEANLEQVMSDMDKAMPGDWFKKVTDPELLKELNQKMVDELKGK